MSTTTVDLSPLMQAVGTFLGVVLPLIAGYIAWLIKRKMNIQQDSADALKIDTAVKRGSGLALDFIQKVMPANPTVDVRNAAIAQGMNHVVASLPDAVARIGVTKDSLTRMVTSELAQLESAAPAASVPAPTPVAWATGITPLTPMSTAAEVVAEPAINTATVTTTTTEATPKTK